jgi:hypothetical protein
MVDDSLSCLSFISNGKESFWVPLCAQIKDSEEGGFSRGRKPGKRLNRNNQQTIHVITIETKVSFFHKEISTLTGTNHNSLLLFYRMCYYKYEKMVLC